ncbi:hypothetical protein VTO42DRAFT_8861 [Malbranchea cinnamomea]
MTDYKLRVSALHPPSSLSSLQHSSSMLPGGIMARGESYPMPYSMTRNLYSLSNSGAFNDMSRYTSYATSRTYDMPTSTPTSLTFGHQNSIPVARSTRPTSSNSDSPPFNETLVLHPIITGNQTTIHPEIIAKIQRGFFQADEKWTCYRRNYFSVSCSFSLRPWAQSTPLYLRLSSHTAEIRSFAMSISAVVNGQENETRELVQHTPKRDKQSERKPGKVTLSATQPPSLLLNRGHQQNQITFGVPPQTSPILDYSSSYATQQATQPPTTHTFERIQFQKATANNGKRRAQQQYYNLVVELFAEISHNGLEPQWVLIAKRLSHPMVVRGRSPGHYKDGRRDSTSMGPNGDSGGPGEGGLGAGMGHGIGHASGGHLSLVPYSSSQQNGSKYDYRQMTSTDHSPLTASPLVSSSSSSPGFDYTVINDSMNPLESIKDTSGVDSYGQHSFTATSSAPRKMTLESSGMRVHLPAYDEESTIKNQEQDSAFGESYDSMIPMLHNGHDPTSHYDKRNSTGVYLNQTNKQSSVSKFNTSYLNRPAEPLYGRYDTIHNPQGLCS